MLSADWRASLKKKIRRDPTATWPDFLPDFAHVLGCAAGTVMSFFFLPWDAKTILLAGTMFTAVTFFVQATLRTDTE